MRIASAVALLAGHAGVMLSQRGTVVLIGAAILASDVAQGQQTVADSSEWRTYRDAKYGYEIDYPSEFEVWPTGPAGERDGRAIRIARREFAAATPVLDIRVRAPGSAVEPMADFAAPDMDVTIGNVAIDGVQARAVTYRWKSNGDVVFVIVHLPGAVIEFHAQPGLRDVRATVWWTIISTFRFRERDKALGRHAVDRVPTRSGAGSYIVETRAIKRLWG